MGPFAAVAIAWVSALGATPAGETAPLAEARQAFAAGRIPRALKALERAERTLGLQEDDLVQVHLLRATCLLATGKRADADRSLDALLELRPLYELSDLDVTPPVRAAFTARQSAYLQARGPLLGAPALAPPGINIPVQDGAGRVTGAVVFFRVPGDATFSEVEASPDESGALHAALDDLPLWERALGAQGMEVVVEGRNARGVPVARLGNSSEPLRLAVSTNDLAAATAALAPPPPPPAPPEPQPAPVPETEMAPVSASSTPPPVLSPTPDATVSAAASRPWVWAIPGGGALASSAAVLAGVLAAVAAGISGGGLYAAYGELTTPGIDRNTGEKQLWTGVFYGAQAGLILGGVVGAVAVLCLVGGLGATLAGAVVAILLG